MTEQDLSKILALSSMRFARLVFPPPVHQWWLGVGRLTGVGSVQLQGVACSEAEGHVSSLRVCDYDVFMGMNASSAFSLTENAGLRECVREGHAVPGCVEHEADVESVHLFFSRKLNRI